jgi:hypothetical protein
MKAKFTFLILSACVLLAIGLAAWLTDKLFDLEIPGAPPQKTAAPEPSVAATTVLETVIEASQPVKPFASGEQPADTQAPLTPRAKPHVQPALPAGFVAEVTAVAGKAIASDKDGKETELRIGIQLGVGHQVRTMAASRVELRLGDDSSLAIAEKTVISLNDFAYVASDPAKCSFHMTIFEGLCRIITGGITALNPDRFKVTTQMATIGVRGCELAFHSSPNQDDIYILGLGNRESVSVECEKGGKQLLNKLTGKSIPVEAGMKASAVFSEPDTVVTIVGGQGMKSRKMDPDEFRRLTADITFRAPVRHRVEVTPKGAIFNLEPERVRESDNKREGK